MIPFKDFNAKNFLGRERELEMLRGIAAEARAGDATSVFLSGKRGTGKTELIRHLYHDLFHGQNDAIPFFHTVKSAFDTLEHFARDYLGSFILQSLAFLKRDQSFLYSGVRSLEDLKLIAQEMADPWAVNMIDSYFHLRGEGDMIKLFSFAISAPYESYASTGLPVVVMIDDFHKIKNMGRDDVDTDDGNCWVLFENYLQSWHTPHIIAGFHSELQRMFFEDTSIGEHLEIVHVAGLHRSDASKLFTSLCKKYGLECDDDLTASLDLFGGNPFYIKSFMQAARRAGRSLSEEAFWDVYVREVTQGKIFIYWASILKSHISKFEQRKPALGFLQILAERESDIEVSGISEELSVTPGELERIITGLNSSGAVETGFSTFEFTDDAILSDIVKGMYLKELRREPFERISDILTAQRRQHMKIDETPSFDVIIPSAPRAELVAVKSLEQIARHYRIASDTAGNVQIALVALFTNVLTGDETGSRSNHLKFKMHDDTFVVEIDTVKTGLELTGTEHESSFNMIRKQVDDLTLEKTAKGTRIVLVMNISEESAAA
jgi:hypothetical protein